MSEEVEGSYNPDSILDSIKKNLGIPYGVDAFDMDIILHINSALAELHQLGVGPNECFVIEDNGATWSDFTDDPRLNMVKTYMYLEVRLAFDPPTASVLSAMERKRDEYEWRLNVAGDDYTIGESQNGIVDDD